MTVKDVLDKYSMTQKAASERFGIPKRTIENWCSESSSGRKCPPYIVCMMDEILSKEKCPED